MRDDDDLFRHALDTAENIINRHHQDYINARRLRAWRVRWYMHFGRWPATAEVVPINAPPASENTAHTNCAVYKFPHYRRQYGQGTVPPGPEDAA